MCEKGNSQWQKLEWYGYRQELKLYQRGSKESRDVRKWDDEEDPDDVVDPDYGVDTGTLENTKEQALKQNKRYIWFYLGTVLLARPHRAYHDHKTYYMNHVVKPYKESVVAFNTRMKEYAECFKDLYLQPLFNKNKKKASKAVWKEKKELTECEICQAIYYPLYGWYGRDQLLDCFDSIQDHWQKKQEEAERQKKKTEKKNKSEPCTKKGGIKKRESEETDEKKGSIC